LKRFAYVCADAGVPIPGNKGSSIHVESVCRALVRRGLDGTVHTIRPAGATLCGLEVLAIEAPAAPPRETTADREARLFLASCHAVPVDAECDFIYERYSLWHAGGLARARSLGIPFVLEVNSPLTVEAARYRTLEHRRLAEGLAELLFREADGVVCVSQQIAEWVAHRRGHDRGVWEVPNGVDTELFTPRGAAPAAPEPDGDGPLVAFVSSFRPWHGADDLLDAFRLVLDGGIPDARLVCVGDGPLRESFEKKVLAAGLARSVHVTGMLPQAEVAAWLRRARVAVAPYPRLEEFYFSPLKIFEAFAMGLPVVAADLGQVRRLLAGGERGLLYEAGNVTELAAALRHLLTDRDRARRLGHAGRSWVLEHATWDHRVASIVERIAGLDTRMRGENRCAR